MRGIFVGPGNDSDDAFICVPHAPFERLLPRARAIVHHAGIGTAMHAFAAGIPQLLVPRAHDQFDNAYRVARTGVGMRMRYAKLDGARAADVLKTLMSSPMVRAACDAARERMKTSDALEKMCALAEKVVR